MSTKVETIKVFAQVGFDRLGRATKDLKKEHLDWKSVPEANNVRWVLTHMSQELNIYIPRILKGEPNYSPNGWPQDYIGNKSYSIEKIMDDVEKGKSELMTGLDKLKDSDLDVEIEMWGSKRKKGQALIGMVSEMIHHEGQISAILGLNKRMEQHK